MSDWNMDNNFRFSDLNTRIYTDDVMLRGSGWSKETEEMRNARIKARDEQRKRREQKEQKKKKNDEIIKINAKKRNARRVFFAILFCVMFYCVGKTAWNLAALTIEKSEAEKKLSDLQKKEYQLEENLKQIHTDEYMEQEARSRLHMIAPGETLYKVTPAKSSGSAVLEGGNGQE